MILTFTDLVARVGASPCVHVWHCTPERGHSSCLVPNVSHSAAFLDLFFGLCLGEVPCGHLHRSGFWGQCRVLSPRNTHIHLPRPTDPHLALRDHLVPLGDPTHCPRHGKHYREHGCWDADRFEHPM